jgi:hypothetical protein
MNRLLCVAALLVVSAGFLLAQNDPELGARLLVGKGSYSIHDKIQLEITRENVGHGELAVSSLWFWGVMRTDVHVFDKLGHEVRTEFLADSVPYPPKPHDFVILGPGEFIGKRLDENATDFVRTPGEYSFLVEYTCEISEDLARKMLQLPDDVPFWGRQRGTISSNEVRVRITP